jgi:hypothetical protein
MVGAFISKTSGSAPTHLGMMLSSGSGNAAASNLDFLVWTRRTNGPFGMGESVYMVSRKRPPATRTERNWASAAPCHVMSAFFVNRQ